jgi:hypothetical protein
MSIASVTFTLWQHHNGIVNWLDCNVKTLIMPVTFPDNAIVQSRRSHNTFCSHDTPFRCLYI